MRCTFFFFFFRVLKNHTWSDILECDIPGDAFKKEASQWNNFLGFSKIVRFLSFKDIKWRKHV